ncbi:hypothetical protein MMC21_005682 [Puttea exsequens]|nr:hypothetical protein [Puttea exsequens]
MDATEAYPKELPPVLALQAKARFKSLDPSIDGKRLRERAAKDSEPRFFAYELWPRIVVTYTQCMLSNPSDKLIALSGIAKRMRDIIQDEYVAGMWRRYLSNELLWNVSNQRQGNQSPPMRSEQYRAPSFSWASVDGCITVPPISDQGMLCSVEDVWIVYVTDDTTGLIKGESLTLKGTLKRLELRRAGSLKTAGTSDTTLQSIDVAAVGFLNATYQQFDYNTDFPLGFEMGSPDNYAAWKLVNLDAIYGPGSSGFFFNETGLQWSMGDGFGGWLGT